MAETPVYVPQQYESVHFSMRPVDKSVLEMAEERIAHCFDRFDHIAVAFSGGKDSTVVLNLTLAEARRRGRLPLDVVFFDEEAIPYETEAYARRVSQEPDVLLRWHCTPVRHRNGASRESPYWWPWDPDCPDKWVRPMPPEATELVGFPTQPPMARLPMPHCNVFLFPPERYGSVGWLMGIRADESMTRRSAVTRRKTENYLLPDAAPNAAGNVYKAYPIYDWRTPDVWTAPAQFGWDTNAAYNLMEMAGLAHTKQRCAPPFGEEPMQNLWIFRTCFPDVWDKMTERVPGAATAARYARTQLYGFGKRSGPPEGMTWEEYIAHYISTHPADVQPFIAQRIAQEIERHFNKTRDPLVVHAPHPESGLSWDFLLMLAMRGDFKGRKRALARITAQNNEAQFHRYHAERQALGL